MSRPSLATPCPAPYPLPGVRRLSTTSFASAQDDTADLEYTRAITKEFKNARPRRLSSFQRRSRKDAPVTIFEDVVEDQELVIAEAKREIGGNTLLGKAARKMPRSSIARQPDAMPEDQAAQNDARSKRRASTLADSIPGLRFKAPEPAKEAPLDARPQGGLKKDPRRRTIFVPSDDTTMLTIHPGANTTDRLNDTFQLPSTAQPPPPISDEPSREKTAPRFGMRRPRMSLAVAPKRLPLQQMASEKGNVPAIDVPGQNGGKENMPPRGQASNTGEKKPMSRLLAPTAASQARGSVHARKPTQAPRSVRVDGMAGTSSAGSVKPRPNDLRRTRPSAPLQQRSSQQRQPDAVSRPKPTLSNKVTAGMGKVAAESRATQRPIVQQSSLRPFRRSPPTQRPRSLDPKTCNLREYPVLTGDLAQPDLYEDDWLRHQEIALTELINQILSGADRNQGEWNDPEMSLRERLVHIYHQPHVSVLHQRLQASLQYGALSTPRDATPLVISHDLGLRKRFLNLWLDSYPEDLLREAAEVVVGRQIPQDRLSGGQWSIGSTLDPHQGRRRLIAFLETFFVDACDLTADVDVEGARWRKMVSRSLMLIWVLDQAKVSGAANGSLFKISSPHKSSTQALHALDKIVIPSSIGDIMRALRHCDYVVSHEQDPLQEVRFHIDNIASDLRDGVILTRLVETLQQSDLSRQLKLPCLSRAQKIFNVDVALSALDRHRRLGETIPSAEDIVNGHREKTLSLLWSLVSTYGLDSLVDFSELAKDIQQHSKDIAIPEDLRCLSQHQQESLLQSWATAICANTDIEISNLSTSFADGCAYAAIVDAFAPFYNNSNQAGSVNESRSTASGSSLSNPQRSCAARLRALGCSTAFTASLTSSTCTISNHQTTISNLAFLASRLLPLKRQHNAAVAIQRAFRLKRASIVASQRIILMRLAHACATVVQTRNRLVHAAIVLQRAWRGVLEARIGRLNADVEDFQVFARGWMARRRAGAGSGRAHSRVMGGW